MWSHLSGFCVLVAPSLGVLQVELLAWHPSTMIGQSYGVGGAKVDKQKRLFCWHIRFKRTTFTGVYYSNFDKGT